jgi:hypothetical protein
MKLPRSTPNDWPSTPQRRWYVAATTLLVGLAVVPTANASPRGSESRPVACFWEPAANLMSFGPALAGTVRVVGTEVESLHRVRCTDDTERWLWMPASFNGSAP